MADPRRRPLGNLALSAAAVLLAALVAEVALRLLGYTPERRGALAHVANGRRTLFLDCYPDNPRGYFEIDLRDANVRERYRRRGITRVDDVAPRAPWAVECRYNSLRFRDAEVGPKPAGVTRLVVLGDSFTEAQGVKEADTLPRVLARLLNQAEPGRFEVRNGGRRATDFPVLFEAFEQLLAHTDPDLVVYAMVLNDAVRPPGFEARQPYLDDWIIDMDRMAAQGAPPAIGFFRPRAVELVRDRVRRYRIGRETTRWYRDMYGPANRAGWEETQRYLREMSRRMRERGGRFLVAVWPLLVGLEGGYPFEEQHRAIERFCLGAGIPYLDLLPLLRGRESSELWVHPLDHHPNELANRLAAEALAGVVTEAEGRSGRSSMQRFWP
jgi:lysophospholipase L1-like esterase